MPCPSSINITTGKWADLFGIGDAPKIDLSPYSQGDLVINAVNGLNIDIKKINQNSVSQTIDAMVKADPQLTWLKEAEARGDVDWQMIKEKGQIYLLLLLGWSGD